MTEDNMERRLNEAMERLAPDDFASVQQACRGRKGSELPNARPRRPWRYNLIAAVLAVVVLAGGGFGVFQYRAEHRVSAVVALDVNPSIELQVNRKDKVIAAKPLNADAEAVLGGMDLKGADVEVAVNALIGAMLRAGYIDELANSVLISVEGGDAQSAELEQRLSAAVSGLLADVQPAVLTQTVSEDAELQAMADAYGISLGRAQLINSILRQDPTKTFEDLAALTVNELNLLASARQGVRQNLTVTGTASEKAYIGAQRAEEIALQRAGTARSSAQGLHTEMDWEKGRLVYSVEFSAAGVEYECDVDASTGDIVDFDWDREDDGQSAPPADPGQWIGKTNAQARALEHAGFSAADVTGLTAELDEDDGFYCYDVEFCAGNTKYEYEIDAATGAVCRHEAEPCDNGAHHHGHHGSQSSGNSGQTSGNSGQSGGSGSQSSLIGADRARQAALDHAGLSIGQTYDMKVELDRDDGVSCYEVEFKSGSMEYEYKIDAQSGSVLEYDSEYDD